MDGGRPEPARLCASELALRVSRDPGFEDFAPGADEARRRFSMDALGGVSDRERSYSFSLLAVPVLAGTFGMFMF